MVEAGRQVVLDTETTGMNKLGVHYEGHRVIEIGCYELVNRKPTGRRFHQYLNPGRPVDPEAVAVHGITDEMLAAKPAFASVADEFLDFISGSELIIHNAAFDVGFLNAELALLDMAPIETVCREVHDTLRMAKDMHPGKKNNLNALCERYGVDNSHRTLHGALLDAEILAEVYVAMTRGQESLIMDLTTEESGQAAIAAQALRSKPRKAHLIVRASESERGEHEKLLAAIQKESKGKCLWLPPTEPAG